jgi:chromosome condensin MukBEF ATPase and DNA-binding subunit MukB
MSEQAAEGTATETTATEQNEQPKPTETVDFWKQKAREQEKRAKDNADAARRLASFEDAQKTEAEKAAERVSKAEAEVASIPAKVSDALREHLVALHQIDKDDAELFLTATEPELLLKQVTRLLGQSDKRRKEGNVAPREGNNPTASGDGSTGFARQLFSEAG